MMKFIGLAFLMALCVVAVTARCEPLLASCKNDCDCCTLTCTKFGCGLPLVPGQIKDYNCTGYKSVSQTSVSSMSTSIFTKCCCCVPLRIGCFILGYVSLAYNTIQTLCLLSLTSIIGIETHGFDHVDTERPATIEEAQEIQAVNQILITQAKMLVLICIINVAWLGVNIACLVGLHKKRPGPIKVYVGFASARLILAMAGFVYLVMSVNYAHTQTILSHSIDLGLTAYFILVYYIYAVQLEKEREETLPSHSINNISLIYPTKLDKQHLVA